MPAEEFEEQKIQDVKYVAFKRSTKHRLIQQFFRWTKGTLHAFERDYVRFQKRLKQTLEYLDYSLKIFTF